MHDTKRSAHKRPFEPTISIIVVMISSLCIHFAEIFFFSFPLFQRLFLSLILCRCSTVFFSTSRICKSAHSFYFFFPSPFLYNLSILFLFISLTISYIMLFYLHRNSPLILSQHNNLAMSLLLCSPNIRVAFPHICFNVPR